MAKTSGLSINVTPEERAKITKLADLSGIENRKSLFMMLVTQELRKYDDPQAHAGADSPA